MTDAEKLIQELNQERQAAKDKEAREAWTKYVSLSVVLTAIVAALATQLNGKYSGTVTMSQAQASDQWAFYQAKSIKQHLVEAELQQIEMSQGSNAATTALVRKLEDEAKRYQSEQADIRKKAEDLERARDDATKHGGKMGAAVSYFALSIAVASLCMVTKRKWIWYLSIAIAVVALAQMFSTWLI